MWQRLGPAGEAASAHVRRCNAVQPFHGWPANMGKICRTRVVAIEHRWNVPPAATPAPTGLILHRRFMATGRDDGSKEGTSTEGASVPAVGSSTEVSTKKQPVEVESIEEILKRSRRKELVERVGPQVERYLPTEDSDALLLPPSRLSPAERWWQRFFVALPWAVFACMLATPLLLVRGHLPFLQKRAEERREAAAERGADSITKELPGFQIVNFGQMPDVLERPTPTMVLLFDSSTFMSKIFLAALNDLTKLLQGAGVCVSVAALDLTASPQPPPEFLWEYPPALAPHLQLVVPRARYGEAGLVEYDGRWTAVALAEAARSISGPYPPAVPLEELKKLDARIEQLRDCLFELLFLEGKADASAAGKPSWWRRPFVRSQPVRVLSASEELDAAMEMEQRLDFSCGIDVAIKACQNALDELRSGAAAKEHT